MKNIKLQKYYNIKLYIKIKFQCQIPVYSCSGWSIQTIESLGNRHEGYHVIEKALHGFYGTQCGFCSPGMIMNMYGYVI